MLFANSTIWSIDLFSQVKSRLLSMFLGVKRWFFVGEPLVCMIVPYYTLPHLPQGVINYSIAGWNIPLVTLFAMFAIEWACIISPMKKGPVSYVVDKTTNQIFGWELIGDRPDSNEPLCSTSLPLTDTIKLTSTQALVLSNEHICLLSPSLLPLSHQNVELNNMEVVVEPGSVNQGRSSNLNPVDPAPVSSFTSYGSMQLSNG